MTGHSAHIGQEVEVQYRWHALYGRSVRRQYVEQRAGGEVVHVELAPGTRLDGELALANQLRVSRPTLRRAIEYLVDRGYLVRRRAVGTQVVHPKVRRPVELTSLYDDLTASR